MLTVEFFGPSGSGKSYLRKKIISKYFKDYKIYDYKSINLNLKHQNFFVKFYFQFIKSELIQKTKKILNIKNLRISFLGFFFKNYQKIIEHEELSKQNAKQFKVIEELIKNSSFDQKRKIDFLRWLKEEMIGNKKAKNFHGSKSILIDSEGLIQRLFIYCYRKKNKKKLIKKYLDNIRLPDILIFFQDIKFEKKINKNISKKEIKKIYLLTLEFLKKKKILLLDAKQGLDYLQKNIYKKLLKY